MKTASHTVALVTWLLSLGPVSAEAQSIDEAKTKLQSGDRAVVEEGIQTLGLLGTRDAVAPLVARVRQGLPADLLETAIVTLMALGAPDAAEVLFELSRHRRGLIRIRAIEAITALNPPGADRTLMVALSDGDPKVRAAAAQGLGEIGAHNALAKLFHALDKGNLEASGAIGKVVKPAEIERLLYYLGKLPFRSLGPALREVLIRSDVPEKRKLVVVARLAELAPPEIKAYLEDLLATSADGMSARFSRAVLRASQQIAE